MSYLIVMPVMHHGYAEACVATMAPEVRDHVLAVDNTVTNIGAAGAYNVGARRVIAEGIDWLITLSPSTRFGPAGGRDFVDYMEGEAADAWVVEADVPVQWHWIAWRRRVFERIGIWDENFWPVYGEDADISIRILTAIDEDRPSNPWRVFPCDAWLMMQGYSTHVGGARIDQGPIWDYYVRKWGGRSGQETYRRPFGDRPLAYWEPVSR